MVLIVRRILAEGTLFEAVFSSMMARWKLSPCFWLIFWPSSAFGRRRGRAAGFGPPSRSHGPDLAGYVWADKTHFWLYCLLAAAGSAVGGLLPYGLGRAGGELFLLKRVNRKHYERIPRPLERQEFLAMMIPSMLPPPTPWKACVLPPASSRCASSPSCCLFFAKACPLAGTIRVGAQLGPAQSMLSSTTDSPCSPSSAAWLWRDLPGGGSKKRAGKLED